MNKKIIVLIITLIILIIPIKIKAYELETEDGYIYSKTLPESGYSYHHTECNGTKVENVTYNEETKTFSINGITEQNNCKFYFNKNGEEIIRTYEVQATVLNGTIDGETRKVVRSNTNATFTLNPTEGYGKPTVTCTNSQTGSVANNTLTVSNVTNDTVCTVEFKELSGAERIIAKSIDNNSDGLIKVFQAGDSSLQFPYSNDSVEYRYSGSNEEVKNYVEFNGETWRIIGVFAVDDGTGKIENRLKIIRNESIGNYSWDNGTSVSSTSNIEEYSNSESLSYEKSDEYDVIFLAPPVSTGDNNWARPSSLNIYLNDNYYNQLTTEAQNMIDNAKFYLGGCISLSIIVKNMWSFERKTEGSDYYIAGRQTNYTSKLALMYSSDYGYASSECRNGEQTLGKYDNEVCTNSNWLYKNIDEWILTASSLYETVPFNIFSTGSIGPAFGSSDSRPVKPVAYLKSNIKIISGDGTKSNPYELEI